MSSYTKVVDVVVLVVIVESGNRMASEIELPLRAYERAQGGRVEPSEGAGGDASKAASRGHFVK